MMFMKKERPLPLSIFRQSSCHILTNKTERFPFSLKLPESALNRVDDSHEATRAPHLWFFFLFCFLPGLDQNMYIFIIQRLSVQFKVW